MGMVPSCYFIRLSGIQPGFVAYTYSGNQVTPQKSLAPHDRGHVRQRLGFEGIQIINAWLSTKQHADLSMEKIGLVRILQTGAFIIADHLQPAGIIPITEYKFCSQDNSLEHHHWQCSHTADLRNVLSAQTQAFVAASPPCTRQRGWFCESPEVGYFKHFLATIPDQTQF